jgi:hypothetical protein
MGQPEIIGNLDVTLWQLLRCSVLAVLAAALALAL